MANALEIDQDVAQLFGDSGDEKSFDGFGKGGFRSFSNDNDSDLDFEVVDAEQEAPDPQEAQVSQPSHLKP